MKAQGSRLKAKEKRDFVNASVTGAAQASRRQTAAGAGASGSPFRQRPLAPSSSAVTVRTAGNPEEAGYRKGQTPKTESLITADVVMLALRSRFNPLRGITPQLLSVYLDQFLLGFVAFAALVWEQIERRDDMVRNVASKRKKAVAKLKRQSLKSEDSPEADAHAEALDEFYDNITVVNALDENETGGFPLLVRQMMDAVGKYYAVHEIVWQPSSGPDGVLTAELRFVPLWFFENRSGRLQFLKVPLGGANGEPLEEGGWMITKGDGVMEACSIAYMFKNMPLKDWVAYSDKFGTPGVLGQTNAAKGSDAGEALKSAVAAFGQNWSGVIYGADGAIKDPITLVQAKGEGALPFPPLVERMDRAMAALWRGSDLSTMSADNKGASVQEDESDILLEDDAAMISETLNLYLDRWIIWQKFGVKPLARSVIEIPKSVDTDRDLKVDELLLKAGARLGERERLQYYGRPLIADDDTPLHNPATVTEKVQDEEKAPTPTEEVANEEAEVGGQRSKDGIEKLIANVLREVGIGVASDLKPVTGRLSKVMNAPDAEFANELAGFIRALPELSKSILSEPNPAAAEAFQRGLTAALFGGMTCPGVAGRRRTATPRPHAKARRREV